MRVIRLIEKIIEYPNENFLCMSNHGYLMRCSLNDWIQWQIFYFGDYLGEAKYARFLKKEINKGDIIIDIGANVGYYTLLFSRLVKESGRIYAFEPFSNTYQKLIENISLNNYKNVHSYNFAIGNINDTVNMSIQSLDNIGTARIINEKNEIDNSNNRSKVISLDKMLSNEKLKSIDWIKIDVEGYEVEVLKGCIKTIIKHKPKFLIEVNNDQLNIYGYKVEDLYEFMLSNDYNSYSLDRGILKSVDYGFQDNMVIIKHKDKYS